MIMNMCIFGAVALGPSIGGLQAEADAWRPLFWIVAGDRARGAGAGGADVRGRAAGRTPTRRVICRRSRSRPSAAWPRSSAPRSSRATASSSPVVIVPLLGGLAAIIVLVVYQYRAKQPLLTIRTMLTSTMPVAGIAVALFAAAASVSATALTAEALAGPTTARCTSALLYLPEVAGAVITAVVLGVVITRRAIHYLPLVGMVVPGRRDRGLRDRGALERRRSTLLGSGLTGIGLGATVAPALFVAGFSLRVGQPAAGVRDRRAAARRRRVHGRADLRPLRRHSRRRPRRRDQIALWIGLALAVGGAVVGVALYLLGGARPQTPDLDALPRRPEARPGTRRRCSPGCVAARHRSSSPPTEGAD